MIKGCRGADKSGFFLDSEKAGFIRELISNDDVKKLFKRRYLGNITSAQEKGEIGSAMDPEFLWLVLEKLNELVREGSWKSVVSEFSQYQQQLRTLLFYGLLTRGEEKR